MILIESLGPQDGKTKDASRFHLYWDVAMDAHRLVTIASEIDARTVRPIETPIAIISEHALQRLFQRLNTIDHRAVLREINPAIDNLFCFIAGLMTAKISPVMAPTPNGALVFRYSPPGEEEAPFIATTWISDKRMRESQFKLDAVQEARVEQGLVVAEDDNFLIISLDRLSRLGEVPAGKDEQFFKLFRASSDGKRRKRQPPTT